MVAFTNWSEQQFSEPIHILEWCPNKDLIAVVLESGGLLIYRVPFQEISRVTYDDLGADVAAIAWRPDGRAIAVALDTGKVYIIDVENGNFLHDFQPTTERLLAAQWFGEQSSKHNHKRIRKSFKSSPHVKERVFEPLPPLPSASVKGAPVQATKSSWALENVNRKEMDLLVLITESGDAIFSVGGHLSAGTIHLERNGSTNRDAISRFYPSQDLNHLFLLHQDPFPAIVRLPVPLIHEHRGTLRDLAAYLAQIEYIREYLKSVFRDMDKEWVLIQREMKKQIYTFEDIMEEHGVKSHFRSTFIHLLLRGSPNQLLEQYLTQKLMNNQALKIWQKTLLSGFTNLSTLATAHGLPAVQRLSSYVQELENLASSETTTLSDLDVAAIQQTLQTCQNMTEQFESLQKELTSTADLFEHFIAWIGAVCQTLENDLESDNYVSLVEVADTQKVLIYLRFHLMEDPIREFFVANMPVADTDPKAIYPPRHHLQTLFTTLCARTKSVWQAQRETKNYPIPSDDLLVLTKSEKIRILSPSYREVEGHAYMVMLLSRSDGFSGACTLRWTLPTKSTAKTIPWFSSVAWSYTFPSSGHDAYLGVIRSCEIFNDDELLIELNSHEEGESVVASYNYRHQMFNEFSWQSSQGCLHDILTDDAVGWQSLMLFHLCVFLLGHVYSIAH
ncbi:anaphase-promoting complex, cyclosome, subunit 4-domain-containing protein [Phlyctochytrium arcticum]|nr:anaphase-promoting complex, cyclosome, subunit 4-domain-containing protein [Phlyctochytrium arcticum]